MFHDLFTITWKIKFHANRVFLNANDQMFIISLFFIFVNVNEIEVAMIAEIEWGQERKSKAIGDAGFFS